MLVVHSSSSPPHCIFLIFSLLLCNACEPREAQQEEGEEGCAKGGWMDGWIAYSGFTSSWFQDFSKPKKGSGVSMSDEARKEKFGSGRAAVQSYKSKQEASRKSAHSYYGGVLSQAYDLKSAARKVRLRFLPCMCFPSDIPSCFEDDGDRRSCWCCRPPRGPPGAVCWYFQWECQGK